MRRPWVEHLEDRSVFSAGALRLADAVSLSLRPDPWAVVFVDNLGIVSEPPSLRGDGLAAPFSGGLPVVPLPVVLDLPTAAPTAVVDWGDGVVTPAAVTVAPDGQTEVVAERVLEVPATYDVELTLFRTANDRTILEFRLTTQAMESTPAPLEATPPTPTLPPPSSPMSELPANPTPPAPAPTPTPETPAQQPVVVRVLFGAPVFLPASQPQFEAGAVRAALAAPDPPTVTVTTSAPAQVSTVRVSWPATPTAAPQPTGADLPTPTVAAPRSLEVVAAGRRDVVPAAEPEADWHGVAVIAPDVEPSDEVLAALAAADVPDALFFPDISEPEQQPVETSGWRAACLILAALAGVGTRHVLRHDPDPTRF